jgi:hypothetical protein
MTVTEPFPPHLGSVASNQLEYTPIEYIKHAEAYAETVLGTVSVAANSAGVACEVLHVEHEQIYQAIIDAAEARKCDFIVMASASRCRGGGPWQRDRQSARAFENSRTRVSLTMFSAHTASFAGRRLGQKEFFIRIGVVPSAPELGGERSPIAGCCDQIGSTGEGLFSRGATREHGGLFPSGRRRCSLC